MEKITVKNLMNSYSLAANNPNTYILIVCATLGRRLQIERDIMLQHPEASNSSSPDVANIIFKNGSCIVITKKMVLGAPHGGLYTKILYDNGINTSTLSRFEI